MLWARKPYRGSPICRPPAWSFEPAIPSQMAVRSHNTSPSDNNRFTKSAARNMPPKDHTACPHRHITDLTVAAPDPLVAKGGFVPRSDHPGRIFTAERDERQILGVLPGGICRSPTAGKGRGCVKTRWRGPFALRFPRLRIPSAPNHDVARIARQNRLGVPRKRNSTQKVRPKGLIRPG